MNVLTSHIVIGAFTFDFVNDFAIETSWEDLTDKGTITLPRNLKWPDGDWNKAIPRGTAVTISAGYNGLLNPIFKGFVTRVKPLVPLVIEVEDQMWKLKQVIVNATCDNESLGAFLERVLAVKVDAFEINVPRFVCNKITGAKLLDKIKTEYGLYSFFKDDVLVVGKQYDGTNAEHTVILNDNIASDDLEYSLKEDFKIKITAISTMPDGSKIEKEFGDPDGDSKTLNFYNILVFDLEGLAKKELERMAYDGYKGSVTLFGEPFVKVGDILKIIDPKESDKQGRYFIDAVTYQFGVSGFRQSVKLGRKA